MSVEAKKCPFCAEEIMTDAIKCKHCGEFLNKNESELLSISDYSKFSLNFPIVLTYILFIIAFLSWKYKGNNNATSDLVLNVFTGVVELCLWIVFYIFLGKLGSSKARNSLRGVIMLQLILITLLSVFDKYSNETWAILFTLIAFIAYAIVMFVSGVKFLKIKDEIFGNSLNGLGRSMKWIPLITILVLIISLIIAGLLDNTKITGYGETISDFIELIPILMIREVFSVAKKNKAIITQ